MARVLKLSADGGADRDSAGTLAEALERLRNDYDVVWIQLPVVDASVETALEELNRARLGLPVIVQLEGGPEDARMDEAIRLTKLGAHYVVPPAAGEAAIMNLLETAALSYRSLRKPVTVESWRDFLVGRSPAMEALTEKIRLIARRRSTVLITGETGTGKEMAARAIHAASSRAAAPLVSINCSALPENLLEAELFGHVRGAFTGAISNRTGRFEQAAGGTIFLDEIGDMPVDLQAKLLRVLQDREFQRLGSSENVRIDVRVIAATNVDLLDRVRDGKFREDLYYRLNVIPLAMPPLRDRLGDVPLLIAHFVEKVCQQEDLPQKAIASETLARLQRYDWPGNVRQLENAVEMAVALSGDRSLLVPGDFPLPTQLAARPLASPISSALTLPESGLDFQQTIGAIELSLLEQALRRANGNKKQAADILRLNRTTLTAKLKSLAAKSGS